MKNNSMMSVKAPMKKYYFEIQFLNHSEIHWTRDTTVDNARDSMWDKYKKAITITYIKEK